MNYEWDERKRAANLAKHGLDFVRADLVFEADVKLTLVSGARRGELRFVDYAELEGILVALVYTLRGNVVRIISFRRAKSKERRAYDAALASRQTHQ